MSDAQNDEKEVIVNDGAGDDKKPDPEQKDPENKKGDEKDPFDFEDDGKSPEDGNKKPDDDKSGEDDDDDTLSPEEKKALQKETKKIVDGEMKGVKDQIEQGRVQGEWDKIKAEYPELDKFSAKILRYAKHDSYRGKSVMQAVMDVAGPSIFVKIGAARAKQANNEAEETKSSGAGARTSANPNPSKVPSFVGKTPDQINKIMSDVRRGKYN